MSAITGHRLAADDPATGSAPLSPWPTAAAGQAAAVARLIAVAGSNGGDDAVAARGEAGAGLVEKYAPGAPQSVKDEAVIRIAGWMMQSDFGGVESETSVGNKEARYFRPPVSVFRYSGAQGLLAYWRVRRAGVIG